MWCRRLFRHIFTTFTTSGGSADVLLPLFLFPALLVVETETFGSHIRIKGKESEHYICMNEKGKIVGRVSIFLKRKKKKTTWFKLSRLISQAELNAAESRSAFSRCFLSFFFCTLQQNPFDNSQPFFHYVISLPLWHSISQLRTAITTMHWETNGHLGGMPLQLYHLVTPGGHKCGDDCMWPCGWSTQPHTPCARTHTRELKKMFIFQNSWLAKGVCDFVGLMNHVVSVAPAAAFQRNFSLFHSRHLMETLNKRRRWP